MNNAIKTVVLTIRAIITDNPMNINEYIVNIYNFKCKKFLRFLYEGFKSIQFRRQSQPNIITDITDTSVHRLLERVVMDLKEKSRVLKIKEAGSFFSCSHYYIKEAQSGKQVYYPYNEIEY